MFGLIYTFISGLIYGGRYVKSEIEDAGNRIEAQAKGDYKYIDSQGRVRRLDNNRQIIERVHVNGELVDVDAKTWKVLYTYPNKKRIEKERKYLAYTEFCEKTNASNKKWAIYSNYKGYMKMIPYPIEQWEGVNSHCKLEYIENESYKEKQHYENK